MPIAARREVIDCVMYSGGDVGAANGEPDLRVWPKVEIMVIGFVVEVRAEPRAASRSDCDVGVPFEMLSSVCWYPESSSTSAWREAGSRARAVTVWPRESASVSRSLPVRPVEPSRKICGSVMVVAFQD